MAHAEQVLNCSFDRWHPAFQAVAFRAQFVPLPKEVVEYLVEDGVYLPENNAALPKRSAPDHSASEDEYREWSDEDESGLENDALQAALFPKVVAAMQRAIAALGGVVIPKLNWSCPKDATWITASNSIKCTNADEALLLLKSSDRVAHDVCNAFDSCIDRPQQEVSYVLVLKSYYDLKPEREFRCFVKGHDLIGACQRDVTQYFPALEGQTGDIEECILEFFEEHIQHKFPDPDYTMDVYVATTGKVRLMDFNPVGGFTAPLLFDWDELGYGVSTTQPSSAAGSQQQSHRSPADSASTNLVDAAAAKPLDFRILTEPTAMRPNKSAYGVPYDLVDTSQGSAMSEMLQQLQEADTALTAMHLVQQSSKPAESCFSPCSRA